MKNAIRIVNAADATAVLRTPWANNLEEEKRSDALGPGHHRTASKQPERGALAAAGGRALRHFLRRTVTSLALWTVGWGWFLVGRWVWRPTLVFGVYPASRRYLDAFAFRSWARWLPLPDLIPIGIIGVNGRWGVCASSTRVLTEEAPESLERITGAFGQIFPAARSVSLAGRWPSALAMAGLPTVTGPVVNGTLGTVYAMDRVCSAMVRETGLSAEQAHLCILGGGGFVGRELLSRLAGRYRRLTAIDPCYEDTDPEDSQGDVQRTASPWPLETADAVLVLTPRGDDARAYAKHASAGQVWGDDCFPDMSPETQDAFLARGALLFKTSLVLDTLRFLPELHTFGRSNVPGCLVAALVNELEPGVCQLDRFNTLADCTGLRAQLFRHQRG